MSRRQDVADPLALAIPQAAIEELRRAVAGDAMVAGDRGYDSARAVWNGMIDRRPAVIVRCKSAADVISRPSASRVSTACPCRSAAAPTTSPVTPSATAA